MRRLSLPLVIAGSVLLAALLTWIVLANATFAPRVAPTAAAATTAPVTRSLPAFTRLDVAGSAEVVLVQGDSESVTYQAKDGRAYLSADVRDGTLRIDSGEAGNWWDLFSDRKGGGLARVTVTFKTLDSIEASGTVRITASSLRTPTLAIDGAGGTSIRIAHLLADRLDVSGSGALQASLSGEVGTQSVEISGAGLYDAPDLVSREARVEVTGAAQVVVHATQTLDATLSGAGQVEFLGDPKVTQQVSGMGRVKRREASGART